MRLVLLFLALLQTSEGALLALDGIVTSSIDPLQNEDQVTIDLKITIPDLDSAPAGTRYTIFESGGDGDGVAIWIDVDTKEIVFYQDRGSHTTSTPANDTTYSLGVATFEEEEVVIRLQNDYSGTTDTSSLTITNGTSTITTGTINLLGDGSDGVGGNNTGLGTISGNIAGNDENGFTYTNFPLAPGESIEAYIYATDSPTMPPPPSIPTPDTYPYIPEPSTLLSCCLAALIFLRIIR